MRLSLCQCFLSEAAQPKPSSADFLHWSRAHGLLDDAVANMEKLAVVRPDVEPVVMDLIDAIQRVQDGLDKLHIGDVRFKR